MAFILALYEACRFRKTYDHFDLFNMNETIGYRLIFVHDYAVQWLGRIPNERKTMGKR